MAVTDYIRVEKKFALDAAQYKELQKRLKDRIVPDEHGASTIYNLYLDDEHYSLIRRSIERPYFKEKIRIRSYGPPEENSEVYFELKRKLDGIGYKRRALLPYQRAMDLIEGKAVAASQIEKEITVFLKRYNAKPKVFLSYRRIPCCLKEDKDLRVTFDSDLKFCLWKEGTTYKNIRKRVNEDKDWTLMEIKTGKAIPRWFDDILSELKIYQAPYSKIGAVYTGFIKENNTTC